MNTVTETPFYSRRLTNGMRTALVSNIQKHIDEEFTKLPLYNECLEMIDVFTEKFWENLYKVMPKSDVDVILKYNNLCTDTRLHIAKSSKWEIDNGQSRWNGSYWGDSKPFGPNMIDRYTIPQNISATAVTHNTLKDLGDEFCEKFYRILDLNECEKKKIISAMTHIIKSATTTGKLVEAYPDMMKFIPDEWKKKEERNNSGSSSVRTVTDVDINAFLK